MGLNLIWCIIRLGRGWEWKQKSVFPLSSKKVLASHFILALSLLGVCWSGPSLENRYTRPAIMLYFIQSKELLILKNTSAIHYYISPTFIVNVEVHQSYLYFKMIPFLGNPHHSDFWISQEPALCSSVKSPT